MFNALNYLLIIALTMFSTHSIAQEKPQEYACEVTPWSDPEYGALVRDLASKGSKGHQFILGLRCASKDTKRAKYWYSSAAEPSVLKLGSEYPDGYALAQYRLALIKIQEEDYEYAISLLELSASQKLAVSQNLLGEFLQKGKGTNKNYERAFELYQLSAMAGCPDAQANLAWLLQLGKGTEQDFMQSMAWAKVSLMHSPIQRPPPKNFRVVIPRINLLKHNLSPSELLEAGELARKYYYTYVESVSKPICPVL